MAKKDYHKRTGLEKIASQWVKLDGLLARGEWSAAIVRAATAAELAANFAIRNEYAKHKLDPTVVDSFMEWANGLAGKMDRLIRPMWALDPQKQEKFSRANTLGKSISKKRNDVVHRGEFCNKGEAQTVHDHAVEFIELVVQIYQPRFNLTDQLAEQDNWPE